MFGQLSGDARYCYGMDISKQAKTQAASDQFCIDGGLDGLVVFNADHDLAALNTYLAANFDNTFFMSDTTMPFWTALTDSVTEDTWKWTDNSNNTYLPWTGGLQPASLPSIDCATMSVTSSLLGDTDCTIKSHVAVCAKANGCHSQPCQHRSTCISNDCSNTTEYTCVCTNGYQGTNCETIKAFDYSGQLFDSSPHCFSLSIDKTLFTKDEATAFCVDGGADYLTVLHEASEVQQLMAYLDGLDSTYYVGDAAKRSWLSLSDATAELTWAWADGSDNTYQPWITAPALNVNSNCALMSATSFGWSEHGCADRTAVPVCAKQNA